MKKYYTPECELMDFAPEGNILVESFTVDPDKKTTIQLSNSFENDGIWDD